MIRHLLARDLKLIARDPAFRVVCLGYLVVFLAASGVFYLGVLAGSESETKHLMTVLFPRIAVLQAALLAGVTPWLVFRFGTRDGVNGLVRLGAEIFVMPWQLVSGRILALALFLAELVCLSLPVLSVALLLGAASLQQIGQALLDTFLFLLPLALIVLHLDMPRRHWALSWVLSYSALLALAYGWYLISSSDYGPVVAPLCLLSIAIFAALLLLRANQSLIYLRV